MRRATSRAPSARHPLTTKRSSPSKPCSPTPSGSSPLTSGSRHHDERFGIITSGFHPPPDVEVRLPDLPRRDPESVASLADAPPHVSPRRVVVLLAQHHQPTTLPVPRGRRGSPLLRLDRLHQHPPRRGAQLAAVHAA